MGDGDNILTNALTRFIKMEKGYVKLQDKTPVQLVLLKTGYEKYF